MVCELSCQYLGANPCRVTLPSAGQSASVQLGRRSGNDGGFEELIRYGKANSKKNGQAVTRVSVRGCEPSSTPVLSR